MHGTVRVPLVPVENKGSKLVEMLDIFKYALEKSNCRYFKGRVYQFEPASVSSYTSE